VYFELEQAEVHFIPSGCYLVSYYDGGSLAFFSIIHPASLYGSVYVRCRPREGLFSAATIASWSRVEFLVECRITKCRHCL